jgi:gliding motility-associated-like protein
MKVSKSLLLACAFCFWTWISLNAQNSNCTNLNFELGNFTNWVGYTWRNSIDEPQINTDPVPGIISRRQTIMSDTSAYDANTGYALRKIPKGYKYCARLGDELMSGDGSGNPRARCWEQSLRYTMTIDSSNCLLIFKFALVLQYAVTHYEVNEPRFKLTLYDSNGNVLPDCSNYDIYASSKHVKGFKTYLPSGSNVPVEWRDWTTVGANLSEYIGQTITIEFMSADCREHWHYGYAYFLAECHPLYITVDYCGSDTTARLEAPEGFEKFSWTDSSGNIIDTLQTLVLPMPVQRSTYTCTLTSATGCVVPLHTTVVKYTPVADFRSIMEDCFTNTVYLVNRSTTNEGKLSSIWNFEDGQTSTQRHPLHTFNTSGRHIVTLFLSNPPSGCKDTLTKEVESFSPPLVGITGDSTYCPGLSTYIKAYGAFDYTWSNGSKADSIEINAPGGTFWLLGRSSTGCVSDTIYETVTEEPYWDFANHADTVICGSENAILAVSGAVGYLWNNGTTNDSIVVSAPGKYSVSGTNARGCWKSLTFNVAGYPLPEAEFSVSPDEIDSKHNTISGTVTSHSGVQYSWNMGDGSYETGEVIQHAFSTSNSILDYMITLRATDLHGCTDTSFKFIDVIPFVPNVFSPNEDGINDVFMQGFELEIVDRNGFQIYKGSTGWDGRYKGDPVDPDTYFYHISYIDSKEKIHYRKGYVTLVR